MAGFTDYVAQGVLNHIVGKTALFSLPTAYVGLFTAVGSDAGSGFTEVSGGSYARKQTAGADWNAASGTGPSTITNANSLTFVTATADWGTVIAFGLFDAPTGGNLMDWDYLGAYAYIPVEISLASPAVLTANAHGYSATDLIAYSVEIAGAAPSFSQSNLSGLLAVVGPSANAFTVTNGGVAVNTSSVGSGLIRKVVPQVIPSGVQAIFAAGQLALFA